MMSLIAVIHLTCVSDHTPGEVLVPTSETCLSFVLFPTDLEGPTKHQVLVRTRLFLKEAVNRGLNRMFSGFFFFYIILHEGSENL